MAHYNSNRIHACLCYWDICSNSRANTCQRGCLTAPQGLFGSKAGALSVIQDNLERGEPARPGPHALAAEATHSSFCPIKSLWRYCLPKLMTGNGKSGFDSGEGAWELATTSKEGSRRANSPIWTTGGSDKKYWRRGASRAYRNENNLTNLSSNHWRASLVPAAAVIPAPRVYIKVVAVKKLVVEFLKIILWLI